jgi:hypothetical protein
MTTMSNRKPPVEAEAPDRLQSGEGQSTTHPRQQGVFQKARVGREEESLISSETI